MRVELQPITLDTFSTCCDLTVGPTQRGFCPENVRSLAEAYVRDDAECFGLHFGGDMIGFAMLVQEAGHIHLHRFMIDFAHQGRGYGRAALDAIIEHVRARPDRSDRLIVMFLIENLAAEHLYQAAGFVDTGELYKNERWRYTERIYAYHFTI